MKKSAATEAPEITRYNKAFLRASDAIRRFVREAAKLKMPVRSICFKQFNASKDPWGRHDCFSVVRVKKPSA